MSAYSTKTSNTSVYCPDCLRRTGRSTSSQAIMRHKEKASGRSGE